MTAAALPAPASENFRWTAARARAAVLLAEDALTDAEIAARADVSDRQLRTWKRHPEFWARVQEHVAALEAATLRYRIARRRERVAALDERWQLMARVIAARGEAMTGEAPGSETGLLVRQVKVVGSGEHQRTVEEYAVDTGLLRELRGTEEQAAREVGQWADRHELSGTGGGPMRFTLLLSAASGAAGDEDGG